MMDRGGPVVYNMDIDMGVRCRICGKPGAVAAGGTSDENAQKLRTEGGVCLNCVNKRMRGVDPTPRQKAKRATPGQGNLPL